MGKSCCRAKTSQFYLFFPALSFSSIHKVPSVKFKVVQVTWPIVAKELPNAVEYRTWIWTPLCKRSLRINPPLSNTNFPPYANSIPTLLYPVCTYGVLGLHVCGVDQLCHVLSMNCLHCVELTSDCYWLLPRTIVYSLLQRHNTR